VIPTGIPQTKRNSAAYLGTVVTMVEMVADQRRRG
jgi:hypothetical protein